LKELQIEPVKLQRLMIANDDKILVPFGGRDADGKDGAVKSIALPFARTCLHNRMIAP